jgi:hypothetical protein
MIPTDERLKAVLDALGNLHDRPSGLDDVAWAVIRRDLESARQRVRMARLGLRLYRKKPHGREEPTP